MTNILEMLVKANMSSVDNANDLVSVTNIRLEKGSDGVKYILADAQNNTNQILKYVFVHFKLYEGENLVAINISYILNLGPKEKWKINSRVDPSIKFDSVKLGAINVYQ
ncbi:FxLYD domain-containing protein [Xenorhabdus bovienii]|uniref:Uncharacterized protein n=5 Tax=Xenorhabdus TaxID=626 RepID=A0ABX7VKP1_XENBU|nr:MULTISPECIES: FxLYD domain-containing protein [Xenorhabdus]MDC9622452.1 FxLYD domain-containing protein [Xenorhabdus aichiensis]MDE1476847.1 FxLYD domain-containing protein [Xenorhabdus bovienii]MDE1486251.1 FxLYD domain-containing protein [Xenorhabdus bovienii]MDE9476990.1 FxLYD domain-containing protein [Xenorhabdus bovienii]MDE9508598.1 FxLYD domain-containing protein [Xenorhabdus bovienii]